MKKIFFALIMTSIFFYLSNLSIAYEKEIKNLSSIMAENITRAGMKKIAVVDFVDLQGNITELGRFIAEEFSVNLAGAKKGFRVVERTHLKTILKEHKLALTGVIDPTTAKKLGQIAGVDALVTGTITPFGESVRLAIKVLDTATGDVIDALSGEISKTKAIEELLGRSIEAGTTETSRTSSVPSSLGKGIEAEGFIFRPVKCRRSGKNTICTITFTNNDKEERQLHLWGQRSFNSRLYSNMYDNLGNQYPVYIQIGNQRSHGAQSLEEKFVPGLPVNVNFVAEDVTPEASSMSVVIGIEEIRRPVAIKNIPITR